MGETFIVLHESDNDHDRHAVAVYCEDSGVIVETFATRDIETLRLLYQARGKHQWKSNWTSNVGFLQTSAM